jgi:hypothetical protein
VDFFDRIGGDFCYCRCFLAVLGKEPRALQMLGKHSTGELHPQSKECDFLNHCVINEMYQHSENMHY